MSQWADRIRNHPVWQHLTALGPSIDQARAREEVDSQTLDGLERVRAVLAFVGKRLATADPFTTHPAPLDGLASAFQNAAAEVQAFIADGSPGHITNANTHADTALQYLAQVAVPRLQRVLRLAQPAPELWRVPQRPRLCHGASASRATRSPPARPLSL